MQHDTNVCTTNFSVATSREGLLQWSLWLHQCLYRYWTVLLSLAYPSITFCQTHIRGLISQLHSSLFQLQLWSQSGTGQRHCLLRCLQWGWGSCQRRSTWRCWCRRGWQHLQSQWTPTGSPLSSQKEQAHSLWWRKWSLDTPWWSICCSLHWREICLEALCRQCRDSGNTYYTVICPHVKVSVHSFCSFKCCRYCT